MGATDMIFTCPKCGNELIVLQEDIDTLEYLGGRAGVRCVSCSKGDTPVLMVCDDESPTLEIVIPIELTWDEEDEKTWPRG